jgi:hypothetical protein
MRDPVSDLRRSTTALVFARPLDALHRAHSGRGSGVRATRVYRRTVWAARSLACCRHRATCALKFGEYDVGTLLGFWSGLLVSWCGMTIGCLLGYVFGARAGRPAVAHLIRMAEIERVEHTAERYGHWVLILFRAVPVLAEISVVFAGISHIRAGCFITVTASSNLGISLVYTGIGFAAADAASFLLAFTGAILVPGIAWFIVKVLE